MKICSVCDRCFEDSEASCFDPAHGELADGRHSVDIVSGYIIERVITSSLKVSIYQARQIEYGQGCAISIAEADATQFLSDAKGAARLFDAGVAGVIESGELSSGSGFAVFEELGGTSLRDVLRNGNLSLLDQIRIARMAAEAVRAIHSVGLLHGVIRPENLSIAGVGTDQLSVKVHNIDLGSALANGILSNRFSMDLSLDSLRYFAPERFRGEAPTAQADVYSLGILLYELLAGVPPFEAASATALADMHLNQKPPEIKIENFDLRMLLTHTIYESLQKQPSSRQSTADLFARQLRHIEQLATHVSTPPPAISVEAPASSINRPITPQPPPRKVQPINVAPALEVLRPAFTPEPTYIEPTPIEPTAFRPEPPYVEQTYIEPTPIEPVPVGLTSIEPAAFRTEPTYIERTCIETAPVEPTPIVLTGFRPEPTYIEPTPVELTYTEPTSTELTFTEPTSTEPTPIEADPVVAESIIEPQQTPTVRPIQTGPPMPFVHTAKRSRLKGMKKRVHAYVSDAKAALTLAPAPMPTPIDWQQPEDDVPSIEAVREELAGSGVIAAFEADEEIAHVRLPAERIEVEWARPTAAKPSPVAAKLAPTATLIDWQQPEDDIPSIEAVREELAGSGGIAAFEADEEINQERFEVKWTEPTAAKPSPVAAKLAPTPILIDWQQPEDDVPSIEAVREELVSSGVMAAFEADEEMAHKRTGVEWTKPTAAKPSPVAAKLAPTPILIDWQQPEDDVPSIEAVREELVSSGVMAAFEADEEITHQRIEVKWSEPTARKPSPVAAEFAPTLMSGRASTDEDLLIFGYQQHGRDLGKLPIYGVAIFAFLIVGFGMYSLGSALADDTNGYVGERRPSRVEIPAPQNRSAAIEPEIAVMNVTAPQQSVPVAVPVDVRPEESSMNKEKTVETLTPEQPKRTGSGKPKAAEVPVKQSSKIGGPIVPSTLVITRAPGKPKAVVVNDNAARESRSTKSGSGSTRPRIVSVPD